MSWLKKLNEWIYRLCGVASALLLLGIVVFTFAQVLSRYVFHYSIKWSSELIIYLLTWMVYLGCVMGYKQDAIVGLSVVTDRLGTRARAVSKVLTPGLLLVFFVISVWANTEVVVFAARKYSTIMKLNLAFVSGSWSAAGCMMGLCAVEKLIDNLKLLARRGETV